MKESVGSMTRKEPIDNDNGLPSYVGRLTSVPLLSSEEEIRLATASQRGCDASRRRLIEANMRLVVNIAKSYYAKSVPFEDLIQEGAIGLMHAVQRFDPEKGYKFSTYATHWIRQAIGRAIDNKSKPIRIPAHVSQTLRKIDKARSATANKLGKEPTSEQVASEMGMSLRRLQMLVQSSQDMLSLDMKVGNDNVTLGSLIQDNNCEDAAAQVLNNEVMDQLHECMSLLNEREQIVMRHKLKMNEAEPSDIREEIAAELKMSRERVRQVEIQAIKKLRRLAQAHKLNDLLSP